MRGARADKMPATTPTDRRRCWRFRIGTADGRKGFRRTWAGGESMPVAAFHPCPPPGRTGTTDKCHAHGL